MGSGIAGIDHVIVGVRALEEARGRWAGSGQDHHSGLQQLRLRGRSDGEPEPARGPLQETDGGVRAFYNVCQHRGNRLRPCGRGTSGSSLSFKCLYHHWEYGIDGTYRRIPDIDTFPQGAPPHGLTEVRCEEWGSFVWFSLNPRAQPLAQFLAPMPLHLDP